MKHKNKLLMLHHLAKCQLVKCLAESQLLTSLQLT